MNPLYAGITPGTLELDDDPSIEDLDALLTVGEDPGLVIPDRELAEGMSNIFAKADGSYGDMWVNHDAKKVRISFGDWEGNLARAAHDAAARKYRGYDIDSETEQGDPSVLRRYNDKTKEIESVPQPGWQAVFRRGEPVHELREAIWDDKRHPRWPPGAQDAEGHNIGGQFMRVGEHFMHGGHRWEIAHIAKGHIIATEASGKIEHAQTRVFTPDEATRTVKGATPAPPVHLKSGKGLGAQHNSPILDADTHPETHDPSIPIPKNSPISPEEWKEFGKADQLYYTELMDRYGQWTPKALSPHNPPQASKAQQVYAKAKAEFGSSDAASIVQHAFGSQYGSSSGKTLSLTGVFDSIISGDKASLRKAMDRYAKAREVEGEINGVVAWDLFNRLRTPSISLIHKSSDSEGFFGDIIEGKHAVMSGLSASYLSTSGWKSNSVGYAVPIRSVVLATDVIGGSFAGEHEFSVADRLKVTPDLATFFTPSQVPGSGGHSAKKSPIWQWIQKHMPDKGKGGNPAGGHIIKGLAAHLLGKSELPLPPAEADFTIIHQPGEKTYSIPPDAFMKEVEAKVAANPGEAITEKIPVKDLGLTPGDVIEGSTPGLRYLVIADPGQSTGLRYLALGKGAPGNYDTPDKNYAFSGPGATRKKVNLHFDIPEPEPEEKAAYNPEEFAPTGDPVQIKNFAVGDSLRISNDDWEVINQSTTQTTVKSKTTGAEATVNPLWKTQKLTPLAAAHKFEAGDWAIFGPTAVKVTSVGPGQTVQGTKPDGSTFTTALSGLKPLPLPDAGAPQKGDVFAHAAQKMVVTNVLKDGTVRARAAVPGAKVQDFEADHPDLVTLFRPSEYAPGGKGKLGEMDPGVLVSGSPVKVRPYMVLGTTGKQTHLLNLETGEQSAVSKNKSYPLLVTHQDVQEPGPVEDHVAAPPSQVEVGQTTTLANLKVGDTFTDPSGSGVNTYQIIGEAPTGEVHKDQPVFHLKSFSTGLEFEMAKSNSNPVVFTGQSPPHPPTPTVDLSSLPDAVEHGGFQPYTSNAGPNNAYKHDKLKMLAEGTVVLDKTGKAWKVKQSGPSPIITDGENLYSVDGNLRGKHSQHAKKPVVFHDHSPPVGGQSDAASKTAMESEPFTGNVDQLSLKTLGLKEGDQFVQDGHVFTVAATGSNGIQAKNEDTGLHEAFANWIIPLSFKKTEQPEPQERGPKDIGATPPAPIDATHEKAMEAADAWLLAHDIKPNLINGIHQVALEKHNAGADWAKAYTEAVSGWGNLLPVPELTAAVQKAAPDWGEDNARVGKAIGAAMIGQPAKVKGHKLTMPTHGNFEVADASGKIVHQGDALTAGNFLHDLPAAAKGEEPPSVPDLFYEASVKQWSNDLPPHSIAKLGNGTIIYHDSQTKTWHKLGGEQVNLPDQMVTVLTPHPNIPTEDEVKPTGQMKDLHDIATGQVFLVGGAQKPYIMLGHGSEGVAAMNLENGSILTGPKGQHKDFELGTFDLAIPPADTTPSEGPQTLGDMSIGDVYKFADSNAKFEITGKTGSQVQVQAVGSANAEWMPSNKPFHSPPTLVSSAPPAGQDEFPITPYGSKYASGGKAVYPHINELAPGEQFADKNGDKYTVYKHNAKQLGQPGSTQVQSHATGGMIDVPHTFEANGKTKPTRVKKLATPTPAGPAHQEGVPVAPEFDIGALSPPGGATAVFHDNFASLFGGGAPSALGLVAAKHAINKAKQTPGQAVPLGDTKASVTKREADNVFVFTAPGGEKYKVNGDSLILAVKTARAITKVEPTPEQTPPEEPPQPEAAPDKVFSAAQAWLKDKGVVLSTIAKIHGSAEEHHAKGNDWPQAYVFAAGDKAADVLNNQHSGIKQPVAAAMNDEPTPAAPEPKLEPLAAGWQDSPTPQPISNIVWEPGDQFYDADGDLHTVVSQDHATGQVETTWGGDDADEHGPMVWDAENPAMKTTKWFHQPLSPSEPSPAAPAAAPAPIPDYTGTKLSKGSKSAGGTTGAQIKIGPQGKEWLVKTYGGNQDRVATELLANGVYRALGVKVADAGTLKQGDQTALTYPLLPGKPTHFSGTDQAKMEALGEDYMADALIGNYDFVGLVDDNVLWNGNEPTRVDQGGTFEYRAQGKPKKYGPVPDDVWSMLTIGQGKNGVRVSETQLRAQAAHIASTLTPEKIDALVSAAPFKDTQMRERLRKNLKARVAWMDDFAAGKIAVPANVKPVLADEPAPTISTPGGSAASVKDVLNTLNAKLGDKAPPPVASVPITPYGSPYQSGGHAPYHKISDLAPGDAFYDKEGTQYSVLAHNGPFTKVQYSPSGGVASTTYSVPHTFTDPKTGKVKPTRVKKIEA